MTLLQIIILAIVQGLTEYLPVSSSAHLILGNRVLGWPDQGLAFDVATHWGTLLAVLIYFRRDLAAMWRSREAVGEPGMETDRRLGGYLLLASLPVIVVGLAAAPWIETHLRSVTVIAWATILFALLLGAADRWAPGERDLRAMNWRAALWIGLGQVLALIPGTSRAGITITVGRALGFGRLAAARFSFLLAIPVITAAGAYGSWQVYRGDALIQWPEFVLAVGVAALAGLVCIWAFLALLERIGLMPFVIYRLLLGALLLAWL